METLTMTDSTTREVQAVARQLVATTEKGTKAIADRLAKIRKEQGITQVEMSKKLKTTQSVYSRYESGEYRLHGELLIQLTKILGITPNDLLGVTESGGKKTEPSEFSVPNRVLRRLRGFDKMTRTDQDILLRTIDMLMGAGTKSRTNEKAAS
jgi:transcriptional regulator with XRE-family HTH domain